MKKVLVIGSTVVDVIIQLEDRLPKTQEDVHVRSQQMSLGGCAFNTSDMIRHFQVPYILFSPIGSGAYGDFVRTQLKDRGVASPIPSPEMANGCCYCFVESGGERTFVSYHGAEYLFEREWFDLLDVSEIDSVYICGLEIEETTGSNIVSWLEEHPKLQVYFAPGPRINRIKPELLARLFALHPILHLNEEEALSYAQNHAPAQGFSHGDASDKPEILPLESASDKPKILSLEPVSGKPEILPAEPASDSFFASPEYQLAGAPRFSLEEAADYLHCQTGGAVIVTLGDKGAYYRTSEESSYVPGFPARQTDTIGAGDSHIGAVIACRQLGMSYRDAVLTANRIAARVVETEGALLSDESFRDAISSQA